MTTPKAKFAGLVLMAVLVLLPCTSTAQQETEESPTALEQSQGTAVEGPAPQSEAPNPSAQQKPTAAQPSPAVPVQSEQPAEKPCDPRCQAAEKREKDDLEAQRSMAGSAAGMITVSWWQFGAGVLGLFALGWTLYYTRKTAIAGRDSADAAQVAVKEAQRQADAAILVEAAKLAVSKVDLAPVGGGAIDKSGIPGDGYTPTVRIRNIGKTRAFILRTSLIMKASLLPPERQYPMASQKQWVVAPGIQAGRIFVIKDKSQTVSLTEEQIAEMTAGKLHLWLFGCIWFKDWFDIRRRHEFLWRWKAAPAPGESKSAKTGFIRYEIAT